MVESFQKKETGKKVLVITSVFFVISFGMFALVSNFFEGTNTLPLPAQENEMVGDAYSFAVAYPEILEKIPCFCGCVNMGHRQNRDCYLDDSGRYVDHGAYCGGCTEVTLSTKELYEEGKSLKEIRAFIDKTYGADPMADPTPTPIF